MIDNKKVMAYNIKKYMEINHVTATDVCNVLHIKHNTFSDWVNGKTYPRIDKIELLANYFGISKADLVEQDAWYSIDGSNDNDALIEAAHKTTLYERYKNANPETQEIIRRLLLLKEGDV